MKKEIFIALKDFKKGQIAVYGTQLAKKLDQYAYLYGVVKVPIITPPVVIDGSILQNTVATQIEQIHDEAERDLEALVSRLKEIHPNVYADAGTGFKEPAVIEETEKKDPFLMVIEGSSDLTTMHEWFGTYETRLVENTTVPALVVPDGYPWKPIRNILYVMDKESENMENMRFLVELSRSFGASIMVVTITNDQQEAADKRAEDTVINLCDSLNFKELVFHQVFTKNISEAIKKLMEHTDADWLAFEHKDRSFLERLFSDYNTEHLILQSKKPVLVF